MASPLTTKDLSNFPDEKRGRGRPRKFREVAPLVSSTNRRFSINRLPGSRRKQIVPLFRPPKNLSLPQNHFTTTMQNQDSSRMENALEWLEENPNEIVRVASSIFGVNL